MAGIGAPVAGKASQDRQGAAMQPLIMRLPGRYWDSYIYQGMLHLFMRDGSIRTIDWEGLIDDIRTAPDLRLAFRCAYLRSDYLYQAAIKDMLRDHEVRDVMLRKFAALSATSVEVSEGLVQKNTVVGQDNPFPFPHADIEIYNNELFCGSVDGLYRATHNKRNKYVISRKALQVWDGPSLGVAASYRTLAVAAGGEGLYDLALDADLSFEPFAPRLLSATPCRDCSWAYYSVFASSDDSGYLASFRLEPPQAAVHLSDEARRFDSIATAREIFGSDGFSWGSQDKLCQLQEGAIKVVKYQPWSNDGEQRRSLGEIRFAPWKGSIVSANTASFGMIVELENALVVFPSQGETKTIAGEPVNWRSFSRSRHYENQLHIVRDDCLEIYSFNQDYLVDQDEKMSGTKVSSQVRRQASTRSR